MFLGAAAVADVVRGLVAVVQPATRSSSRAGSRTARSGAHGPCGLIDYPPARLWHVRASQGSVPWWQAWRQLRRRARSHRPTVQGHAGRWSGRLPWKQGTRPDRLSGLEGVSASKRKPQARFCVPAPRPVSPARGLTASAPPPAARPNDSAALAGPARAAGGREMRPGTRPTGPAGRRGDGRGWWWARSRAGHSAGSRRRQAAGRDGWKSPLRVAGRARCPPAPR